MTNKHSKGLDAIKDFIHTHVPHIHVVNGHKHHDLHSAVLEKKDTHYRQWKKGKSWVYSAGMLTILLGGVALDTAVGLENATIVWAAELGPRETKISNLLTDVKSAVAESTTLTGLASYTALTTITITDGPSANSALTQIITFLNDVISKAPAGDATSALQAAVTSLGQGGPGSDNAMANVPSLLAPVVSDIIANEKPSEWTTLEGDIATLKARTDIYVSNEPMSSSDATTIGTAISKLPTTIADSDTYSSASVAYNAITSAITSAESERDTAAAALYNLYTSNQGFDVILLTNYGNYTADYGNAKTTNVLTATLQSDYTNLLAEMEQASENLVLKDAVSSYSVSPVDNETVKNGDASQTLEQWLAQIKTSASELTVNSTSDDYNAVNTLFGEIQQETTSQKTARTTALETAQSALDAYSATTTTTKVKQAVRENYYDVIDNVTIGEDGTVTATTLTSAELTSYANTLTRNIGLASARDAEIASANQAIQTYILLDNEIGYSKAYNALDALVTAAKNSDFDNMATATSNLQSGITAFTTVMTPLQTARDEAIATAQAAVTTYAALTDNKVKTNVADEYNALAGAVAISAENVVSDNGSTISSDITTYAEALTDAITLENAKQTALTNNTGGYVANEPEVKNALVEFVTAVGTSTNQAGIDTAVDTLNGIISSAEEARDNAIVVAGSLIDINDGLEEAKSDLSTILSTIPSSTNDVVLTDINTTSDLVSAINVYKATQKSSLTVPDAGYVANEPYGTSQGAPTIGAVKDKIDTQLDNFTGTGIDPFDYSDTKTAIASLSTIISNAKDSRDAAIAAASAYVGTGKTEPAYFVADGAADQAFDALSTYYATISSSSKALTDENATYTTSGLESSISSYESAFKLAAVAQANALLSDNGGYVGNELAVSDGITDLNTAVSADAATGTSIDAKITALNSAITTAEGLRDTALTNASSALSLDTDGLSDNTSLMTLKSTLQSMYDTMVSDKADNQVTTASNTTDALDAARTAFVNALGQARWSSLQTAISSAQSAITSSDYLSSEDATGKPGPGQTNQTPYADAVGILQAAITVANGYTEASSASDLTSAASSLNTAIATFSDSIKDLKDARDTAVTNANAAITAAKAYTDADLQKKVSVLQTLVDGAYA
jgi:hypothetical protein